MMSVMSGLAVFHRKCRTLFLMILSVPVVFLIRMLGPLVQIRFGPFSGERIGTFAGYMDMYLCHRRVGLDNQRTLDIFYHRYSISNHQLNKMYGRVVHISPLSRYPDWINRRIPGGQNHIIPRPSFRDVDGLCQDAPPFISFTPEEERQGSRALRQMGIPDGTRFVRFHARDSAYLDAQFPNAEWRYHDHRDANIENVIPSMEALTRRGYFAVRMGAKVKKALTSTNPKIIDYATNGHRTEFMDVYLGARCKFFIGDTAGIYVISDIFRRPIVWINNLPLELVHTWAARDLFIPKKLWLSGERRFLTFREILDSEIGRSNDSHRYQVKGIEPIENTPEEIAAVVEEMNKRLEGTWKTTQEDEELQKHFWKLFKPSKFNHVFQIRIGTTFLRENRALLESSFLLKEHVTL